LWLSVTKGAEVLPVTGRAFNTLLNGSARMGPEMAPRPRRALDGTAAA
jgi:plasmid maintenance system antidote protein VapI